MLTGGEDPLYIARRLVVVASEDVGLGDPHGLPLVRVSSASSHKLTDPTGDCDVSSMSDHWYAGMPHQSCSMSYFTLRHFADE